jgi:hypothetical protein
MFDFLIVRGSPYPFCLQTDTVPLLSQDIVPRTERAAAASSAPSTSNAGASTSTGKRSSRARKASQREAEEAEDDADGEPKSNIVTPHPLMEAVDPNSYGLAAGEGEPASKRSRYEEPVGMDGAEADDSAAQDQGAVAMEQATSQQPAGYYALPTEGGAGPVRFFLSFSLISPT